MNTLPPRLKRVVERLRELAEEGRAVARLPKEAYMGQAYIQGVDKVVAEAWLTKTENIIRSTFGEDSAHHQRLVHRAKDGVEHDYEVYPIVGVIEAALDDLVNGFLTSQEFLIAGEVFDNVLDQAKHLASADYKDPAAILARVVLEDALKRLARESGINDRTKAAQINDELWKAGRFSKPQWRRLQSWLDLGNAAAHGEFDSYSRDDVVRLLDDLKSFLASEFRG